MDEGDGLAKSSNQKSTTCTESLSYDDQKMKQYFFISNHCPLGKFEDTGHHSNHLLHPHSQPGLSISYCKFFAVSPSSPCL